jgi:hypothetical protein
MEVHATETPSDTGLPDSIQELIDIDEFTQYILEHIIPNRASLRTFLETSSILQPV